MAKKTRPFYDKIYTKLFKKGYTKTSDRGNGPRKKLNRYLESRNEKLQSILDVGCAWGKTLEYYKEQGVKRIVGIDVSKITVKYCNSRKFKCYVASATSIKVIANKSVDLYISTDVYEHLREEDLIAAISEAKRVSKKYIVIRVHAGIDKRKKLHLTVWAYERWMQFFIDNGLEIIEIDGEIYSNGTFIMRSKI